MKIVVIGGTGLIGSKLVALLRQRGQEVLAASPDSGVNTLTGEGLSAALAGAQAVVDVANSPSFEDAAAMMFFQTSGQNLLAAEARPAYGITLRSRSSARIDCRQWILARQGGAGEPDQGVRDALHVVRSTQFFEFRRDRPCGYGRGDSSRVPCRVDPADRFRRRRRRDGRGRPLPAPMNGIVEIAGPESMPLDELVRRVPDRDGRPAQGGRGRPTRATSASS